MLSEELVQAASETRVIITDGARLIDAARLLNSGTDLVLVCDSGGFLLGVVTKTDVVRQISSCEGANCLCLISTVMTRDVAWCRAADRLEDVAALMKARHLKNVPIVDADNRPVGVLTARVVLRALLSDAKLEETQLIDYISGVGYR